MPVSTSTSVKRLATAASWSSVIPSNSGIERRSSVRMGTILPRVWRGEPRVRDLLAVHEAERMAGGVLEDAVAALGRA
ncbi:hypothetical protein GCM10009843_22740 [Nocardioides bigeumensis]|uniref:Uncharacterized protein n=1 Tax=Nocardioides bigeumensis TaxID=433657 RepID=A0ABP5K015_9ACTN